MRQVPKKYQRNNIVHGLSFLIFAQTNYLMKSVYYWTLAIFKNANR